MVYFHKAFNAAEYSWEVFILSETLSLDEKPSFDADWALLRNKEKVLLRPPLNADHPTDDLH